MNGHWVWLLAPCFARTKARDCLPAMHSAERTAVWSRPYRAATGARWIKACTGGKGENGEVTMFGVSEEVALAVGEIQSPAWPN